MGQHQGKKLAKTRRTVLKIQLEHFAKSGQWHYWLLAVAAYVWKNADDLLRRAGIQSGISKREVVSTSVTHEWYAILGDLQLIQERKNDA